MSTYTPIATQTLGSAAASVTFSSIPQGYTDLVLVCNIAQSSGNNSLRYRFNGDTGSNYSDTYLYGNGTSAGSGRDTSQTSGTIYVTGSTTIEANYIVQFMNYSNATTYKTVLGRSNRASSEVAADVGLWRSTSAINSISLAMGGSFPTNNFASGSTFSLYGIQVGDKAQKAQGGNIVTSDGTYVYHTFTSSGAFIPSQALTVDYLVVAGGGGAGGSALDGNGSGGGGAGGLRSTVTATGGGGSLESALSLTAKSYSVIVGAGGTGGLAAGSTKGSSGNNSIFGTITSTGGGGGAGSSSGQNTALTGGSGGGGSPYITAPNGAAGTANQGYAGGNPINSGSYGAGGGGGAGAVGANAGGTGGNGGNGVAVSISGSSVTYAGGGGGGVYGNFTSGTGGTGGGGNAGAGNGTNAGNAGTANTGGGGGGGSTFNTGVGAAGGNGGSGIVIIRYAI
jgi:hypothetical protein